MNLVLELVAGAANTHAERVTALNHEVLDNTVEHHIFVERSVHDLAAAGVLPLFRTVCQTDKVLNGQRCMVAKEINDNITVVGVNSCLSCCISHRSILSCCLYDALEAALSRRHVKFSLLRKHGRFISIFS